MVDALLIRTVDFSFDFIINSHDLKHTTTISSKQAHSAIQLQASNQNKCVTLHIAELQRTISLWHFRF